ncbi:hypothetical protein ICW40_04985 [Actinotalea ferrariae]|uniref:hypothetical protein n=1 Tax=Actinotalea ferrariae TaxID=1386098 RepID=UPI001C8BA7D1|nr:hypothetical protein [Actinotalea ferrariae]MBX9244162.1 hypothetical protein [Actinotalea ferrariae]
MIDLTDGRTLARLAGTFVIGVVVGVVGTAVHRWQVPWGLVLALVTVLCAGVLARAWVGWAGMLLVALAVVTTVAILAGRGPGGDLLVAAQPVGYVWYGGALVVALAGLAPRRWFSDRPLGGSQG